MKMSESSIKIEGSPNYLHKKTVTVGTTAVQALHKNKKRAGYRIISLSSNVDSIYHGHNSRVTSTSVDQILPGGKLIDEGVWETIYRGEVWLISGTASQSVEVEEIVKV